MKNQINKGRENLVQIGDMKPGDTFCFRLSSGLAIISDYNSSPGVRLCVNLETGAFVLMDEEIKRQPIKLSFTNE